MLIQCGITMEGNKQLEWCFRLKDGLKVIEPNERLAKSYLEKAKSSLDRAEKNFKDKDLLWATVVFYYAEYYALYSFLQKIGIKCENHSCSILAISVILGQDKTAIINQHKDKRIDAQYYIKIGKEQEVAKMLQEAKIFVSMFDDIVSNLSQEEINAYRSKFEALYDKKK